MPVDDENPHRLHRTPHRWRPRIYQQTHRQISGSQRDARDRHREAERNTADTTPLDRKIAEHRDPFDALTDPAKLILAKRLRQLAALALPLVHRSNDRALR